MTAAVAEETLEELEGGRPEGSGLCVSGRYYDPATAQFMSVDPLVDTTRQAYGYASDDPLDRQDPAGLHAYGCDGVGGQCTYQDVTGSSSVPTVPVTVYTGPTVTYLYSSGAVQVTMEASATAAGPNSLSSVKVNPGRGSIGVSASTSGSPSSTASVTVTRSGVSGAVTSTAGPVSYGVSVDGGLVINWSQSYPSLGDTFMVDVTTTISPRAKPPNLEPIAAPVSAALAVPIAVYGGARALCNVPPVRYVPLLGSACPTYQR